MAGLYTTSPIGDVSIASRPTGKPSGKGKGGDNPKKGGGKGPVVSIERVQVSIAAAATTATVNLTGGQDETKCVPFYTVRYPTLAAADDRTSQGKFDIELIDNSGTPAVRVTRSEGVNAHDVYVDVVEFNDSVTVQQIEIPSQAGLTFSIACSSVTAAKTFIIPTLRANSTGTDDDIWAADVRAEFASATQVDFTRVDAGVSLIGTLYLVEDADGTNWDVQHITSSKVNVAAADVTIPTAVDVDKTMLLTTCSNNYGAHSVNAAGWDVYVYDTTTIKALSGTATHTHNFAFQAVTFLDGSTVQSGRETIVVPGAANNDNVVEIALTNKVTKAKSMVIATKVGYQDGIAGTCSVEGAGAYSPAKFEMAVKSGGNAVLLTSNTQPASSTFIIPWQCIEWNF
jgi:hypothetical protein